MGGPTARWAAGTSGRRGTHMQLALHRNPPHAHTFGILLFTISWRTWASWTPGRLGMCCVPMEWTGTGAGATKCAPLPTTWVEKRRGLNDLQGKGSLAYLATFSNHLQDVGREKGSKGCRQRRFHRHLPHYSGWFMCATQERADALYSGSPQKGSDVQRPSSCPLLTALPPPQPSKYCTPPDTVFFNKVGGGQGEGLTIWNNLVSSCTLPSCLPLEDTNALKRAAF
mmetsp:Transcript_131314/g.227296  ORF Transcript_131314/g.227296 Transcript_131314/m.227296 type:complete len:226 (-) Transcript_131314:176-853(-)